MRARTVALLATGLACAVLAAAALAQPPEGIVRPADESATPRARLGAELYAGNCASCHGIGGAGVFPPHAQAGSGNITGLGPSLRGVGALAADFYLRTGYMPLGNANDQPSRHRPAFDDREIRALEGYVASFAGGPGVPATHPERGSAADGLKLFTEHCAGCHQVAAQGGIVTGAKVPTLESATPTQIAEAVRVGPYLMPRFSEREISSGQLDSIIAYVRLAQHPVDRGGWGIGNIGPVPEGLITLLAVIAFVAACAAIGERVRT